MNSILGQMNHFTRIYKEFTNEEISLYIDRSDKIDLETEVFMDITLKHYPLRDFKSMYSEMSNVVRNYSKLNHRNSKKDELHLNKHSMHLIRLLITGTEILKGKGVHTYRAKEKEFLLSIRNGEYSYEKIFEMVDELEEEFRYAAENTDLPDEPDYKAAEELLIAIYDRML